MLLMYYFRQNHTEVEGPVRSEVAKSEPTVLQFLEDPLAVSFCIY